MIRQSRSRNNTHKGARLGLRGSANPNQCRRLPEGETMEKKTKSLARDGEWERKNVRHPHCTVVRKFFSGRNCKLD